MLRVWLYHINPKSRYGYEYGWDLERPQTILRSRDRTWSAGKYFNQVAVGDLICVYMKKLGKKPDGVYVVGTVTTANPEAASFRWRPDSARSARTLVFPILPSTIKKYFPRSYGDSIQPLDEAKRRRWTALLRSGEETDGIPRIKARGRPNSTKPPAGNPEASQKHGRLGEGHVLKILRERYKPANGFTVVHVSARTPGADHDIEVRQRNRVVRLVEVKTRVGKAGDPVLISEREILCRRARRGRHSIFVVYLGANSRIREVMEIGASDDFALRPQQHWLYPGTT